MFEKGFLNFILKISYFDLKNIDGGVMNKIYFYLLFLLIWVSTCFGREISPIVTIDWLEKNINNSKVVIIDIRREEEYKNGHIPGAVNVFLGVWSIDRKNLKNEIPDDDALIDIIRNAEISNDSLVVVAGLADSLSDLVNMTRVLFTLKYAGINNVAVLDGGINKWIKEQKKFSQDFVKPKTRDFIPRWNRNILANKEYVMNKIDKAIILDTRSSDVFYGVTKVDFVEKAGHIKGAKNLPSSWLYGKDNIYRNIDEMQAIAEGTVGRDKKKEIIVYCDSGKFATAWWFVLSEILGYENVKLYDGSMQEWCKDPNAPVVRYSWD